MSSGDLIRKLFSGYAAHDDGAFRLAAEALVQEERAKNHRLLADDLERILLNGNGSERKKSSAALTQPVPRDRERGFPLLSVLQTSDDWDRIVVRTSLLDTLRQIVREHHRQDVLAAAGMKPTQRILFYGPPGCGKTLAARVMAGALSLPLVTVRFDAIVSSYLGETAANLRRVFDFIETEHSVVLFDEFDAIGKDRDNQFEHGELKRVVNALLQLMDVFSGKSLLIAATNHEKILDSAVWRRFEAVLEFGLPALQDRVLIMRHCLRGFDCTRLNFPAVARRMKRASGSDIELVAITVARRAVLDGRRHIESADIDAALSVWRERAAAVLRVDSHPPGAAKRPVDEVGLINEAD